MSKDKKNVIWNMLGASANAFNSLLFAIVVTRVNGVNEAGIFTYSFATACLFYMIAVYAGRTFQVTDITGKNSDSDYIYHRIITCIIMILVSIIFVLVKQYDIYKSSIFVILCIFKCVEAFSESIYAIIQKNDSLYKVGISLFLKAVISIITFTISNYITKNLLISCISIVLVNIILLIIYDFRNMKKLEFVKTKLSKKSMMQIFKIGFFTFLLTFLGNYLINAPRYAIDDILTNDLQTIFGIIIMPATLMGLLGQYIIQPCLVGISNSIKNKKYKELRKTIIKLASIIIGFGCVVIIGAYLLEQKVLELVYGVDLSMHITSMMIIVVGSILYSLSTILSALLIAMRKTKIQAYMYIIVAIIATILSYNLVNKIQIVGASITYLLTMLLITVLFTVYITYCMRIYKKEWKEHID